MARRQIPSNRRSSSGARRTRAGARRSRTGSKGYEFHSSSGRGPRKKPSAAKSAAPNSRSKAGKPKSPRRSRKQSGSGRGKGGGLGGWSGALFGISWIAILFGMALLGLPALLPEPPVHLYAATKEPAITVLDRHKVRIGARGLAHGDPVKLEDMPSYLPEAVLAVEDRRFRWHIGIDFFGLGRAAWANWHAGEVVQGGSTITQQLAKNLFLSPERTWKRKAQEAVYALWLEQKLTKDEILELYLNRVYLGAGTHGVEGASQRYFGKSATEVTLVEAAMLAGLLKAPSRYTPTRSLTRANDRTALVLDSMVEAGFLTSQERKQAHASPARIRPAAASAGSDYVLDWVAAQIPDYVGPSGKDIIVTTTIDLDLQRAAEKALAGTLDEFGETRQASEGAVVSLSPQGAVRALVGGRAYQNSPFNRAITARRQPGSAFKPFVYVAAMEAGWLPWHVLVDKPLSRGRWAPSNYTRTHRGSVTLETALAQSINTVAVDLGDRVGRETVIAAARRFGILSPLEPHPSLALGTQEVSLYELTAAYSPFANGGLRALPHIIAEIKTKDGEVIYARQEPKEKRIAEPFTIGALNYMLRSAMERGTGRQARLADHVGAGKTGTSGDYRDAWFMGYTKHLVTGVWIGNDDGAPMKKVTGGSLPAKVWRAYMASASQGNSASNLPFEDLVVPPAIAPQGLTGSVLSHPPALAVPPPATREPKGFFERIAEALKRQSSVN